MLAMNRRLERIRRVVYRQEIPVCTKVLAEN